MAEVLTFPLAIETHEQETPVTPEHAPRPATHWYCPDCGSGCSCTGDARLLAHQRCGVPR